MKKLLSNLKRETLLAVIVDAVAFHKRSDTVGQLDELYFISYVFLSNHLIQTVEEARMFKAIVTDENLEALKAIQPYNYNKIQITT